MTAKNQIQGFAPIRCEGAKGSTRGRLIGLNHPPFCWGERGNKVCKCFKADGLVVQRTMLSALIPCGS